MDAADCQQPRRSFGAAYKSMQRTELRLDVKMKFKVSPLIALLVLLIGTVASVRAAAPVAKPAQQEPPLRLSEPVEAVVADLEGYIPEYMRQENVPGVAIALIRDGEVVWTEGFGVANAFTRQPGKSLRPGARLFLFGGWISILAGRDRASNRRIT